MDKYLKIREDNNGRTIEAWAFVSEAKPLLPSKTLEIPAFLIVSSMFFWGLAGIYIGNLIFN